ncbi:MAG: carbohydrate binding domain-containing protein [Spirochaetales bacterium]|nr:carbohydrate binding domain-containing protein [Spirochaetales bacterium]
MTSVGAAGKIATAFTLCAGFVFLFSCSTGASVTTQEEGAPMFPFVIPWDDAEHTVIHQGSPDPVPAGERGFITVSPEGHLLEGDARIRFWGTNVCFGSAFPRKEDAPLIAAHLAKFGVNMVRFHHMDMTREPGGIWQKQGFDRVLSPQQLDRLDYFIAQLKRQGIYINLNLLVSRPFVGGTDLHEDLDSISEWKSRAAVGFFDDDILQLQKQYARDLLLHVNPYTGTAYAREPAVACVEINNENGMLHEYLSATFDELPAYYRNNLKNRWNDWLKTRYVTLSALKEAWGSSSSSDGVELLRNGSFSEGLSHWHGEEHDLADTGFSAVPGAAGTTARIEIKKPGTKGWHVQFNQPGIPVTTDAPYSLHFHARASGNRDIEVSVAMAHEPWEGLGFRKEIGLSREWKEFRFPGILVHAKDANARLNFSGMGLDTGWVEIRGVSFVRGGFAGLTHGENPWEASVPLFTTTEAALRNETARKDWFEFLLSTEERYWLQMKKFLKEDLAVKPLLIGTIVGCSTPNLMAQFDIVDTHAYWTHPVFPRKSWSTTDWYIENKAMVNRPLQSTVADLALRSVLGKPHAVTEYNHPHPNTYEAEAFYLLAAYASLQDWDMVLPFSYSHRGDEWETGFIPNYFDIDQNPVKMVSMLTAAKAFREFHIQPAKDTLVVPFGREEEYRYALSARPWSLLSASMAGVPSEAGLLRKVRLATGELDGVTHHEGGPDRSKPQQYAPSVPGPDGLFVSDTEELLWDVRETGKGYLLADTARSFFAAGFLGQRLLNTDSLTLHGVESLQNGFAAIAVTVLDGKSLSESGHLLVTALGTQDNTGRIWYRYPDMNIEFPPAEGEQITLKNDFGKAPSLAEGVRAVLVFKGCSPEKISIWALDPKGARKAQIPTRSDGTGGAEFSINPDHTTLWYEVEIRR